jgi:hypothetical protein
MSKSLIILLTLVILLAIGLNLDEPTSNSSEKKNHLQSTTTNIKKPLEEDNVSKVIQPTPVLKLKKVVENNLTAEIMNLTKQANHLFQTSKDEEALELYFKIINKTKNSQDVQLLKYFSEAYSQVAFLYQIYPNNDKDASIEAYDMLIKKLENSKNPELLGLFINAKIQQSYLLDNDERLEIYDELIKKFENHESKDLQKKVEELLINKSFELMGKNDEEAMQILDSLIDKYQEQDNVVLPEEIELAILNNLELSIITNNDDNKYIELANKYLSKSPDTKPLLDMLEIIKNAQDLNQDEALETWKDQHKNYRFNDWSFQELRRWINKVEDKETRERVSKYINAFESHKYNQEREENRKKKNAISPTEVIILDSTKYVASPEEILETEEII